MQPTFRVAEARRTTEREVAYRMCEDALGVALAAVADFKSRKLVRGFDDLVGVCVIQA